MTNSDGRKDYLGYDLYISNILNYFNPTQFVIPLFLEGSVGSGKSYVLQEVAKRWISYSDVNESMIIEGRLGCSQRELFPWTEAVREWRPKGVKKFLIKSVEEISRAVPLAGDFVSFLINSIANKEEARRRQDTQALNELERYLLEQLLTISKGKNLLILVDDVQFLDEGSKKFLLYLMDRLVAKHPELMQFRFLLVTTINEGHASSALSDPLTKDFPVVKLPFVTFENIDKALKQFGYTKAVDLNTRQLFYSLTEGNLTLVKLLSDYLNANEQDAAFSIETMRFGDGDSFVQNLLEAKLKSAGASGQQVRDLLDYASVIGISFTFEEIACLSSKDEEALSEIISKASASRLLLETDGKHYFSSEVVHAFFLNRLENRKFKYYKLFAGCLSKLRPSDYLSRANLYFEAGDIERSIQLYISGALKNIREGLDVSDLVKRRIHEFGGATTVSYYRLMDEAYRKFLDGEFDTAKAILTIIEDFLPIPLMAEKYYLLTLCQTKSMQKQDLQSAKDFLTGWDDLQAEESELWLRLMTTLMTINADMYQLDEARAIERRIMMLLTKRAAFDSAALFSLNVIRRKASALYVNEVALLRTRQSVEYFSSADTEGNLAYPVQFYLSLTNYAANLFESGTYKEAFRFSQKALEVKNKHSWLNFPEPYIPSSNYIISGISAGVFSWKEALHMYEELARKQADVADDILLLNNLYVSRVHNDKLKEAFDNFLSLYQSIEKTSVDPYYTYVVASNLCALYYLTGDAEMAKILWQQLMLSTPHIPDKHFLEKRQELLVHAFDSVAEGDWQSWDSFLKRNYNDELGPAWQFYNRGFLLSDIQLWHES